MTSDLDDLFQGNKADVFYSDPPWGAGNLNFWRTYNGQKGHDTDWMKFVRRVKFLADRHTTGPKFIETGLRFEQDIIAVFGKPQGRYIIRYKGGGKVLDNLLLGYGEQPKLDPSGKTGFDVPFTVLSSLPTPPKSVFDCCVGLGTTARVAKKLGLVCYANELNPKRAAKTMKILDFALCGKD
jgi:hypothetical protein